MPQGSRGGALPGCSAGLVGQAGGRVRPNGDGVGGAHEVGVVDAFQALAGADVARGVPRGGRGVLHAFGIRLTGEPNLRVGASVRCVGDGERAGEAGPHYALTALRAYRLTTPIICVTVLMQSYRRSDEAVRLRS